MKAVFIELPAFERYRADYLDDEALAGLQQILMKNPEAGEVIEGTGGLCRMRLADACRGKGKRLRMNVRTLENREQGRAKPNAQAALLINLVRRFPDTVERLAAI